MRIEFNDQTVEDVADGDLGLRDLIGAEQVLGVSCSEGVGTLGFTLAAAYHHLKRTGRLNGLPTFDGWVDTISKIDRDSEPPEASEPAPKD